MTAVARVEDNIGSRAHTHVVNYTLFDVQGTGFSGIKGHKRISRKWPVTSRLGGVDGAELICYELITSDRTHGEVSVSPFLIEPYSLTSHSICNSIFCVNCNYTLFSHIVTMIMICNVCLKTCVCLLASKYWKYVFQGPCLHLHVFVVLRRNRISNNAPSTRPNLKKEPNLYCIIKRQ